MYCISKSIPRTNQGGNPLIGQEGAVHGVKSIKAHTEAGAVKWKLDIIFYSLTADGGWMTDAI